MNFRTLFFLLTVAGCVTAFFHAGAQDKPKKWPPTKYPHDPKNCFHLLSNSYQCSWIFYGLKAPVDALVIAYDTIAPVKTGPARVCVSIVKAGNDTVRVLHLVASKHKPGDIIRITQAREPELDVLVPFDREFFMSEENNGNAPQCRINEYDGRVYKTTWADIVTPSFSVRKKAPVGNKPVVGK
jgi:hypothetical protein